MALLGPSGAGKTLTLDSIAGFVKPDAGRILLDDAILFDADAQVHLGRTLEDILRALGATRIYVTDFSVASGGIDSGHLRRRFDIAREMGADFCFDTNEENAPGQRKELFDRIRDEIWLKLWGNVCFNPISALTGGTLEELARDPDDPIDHPETEQRVQVLADLRSFIGTENDVVLLAASGSGAITTGALGGNTALGATSLTAVNNAISTGTINTTGLAAAEQHGAGSADNRSSTHSFGTSASTSANAGSSRD